MPPRDEPQEEALGRGWRRFLLILAFTPPTLAFVLADLLLNQSWLWAVPLVGVVAACFVLARRIPRARG